MKLRTAGAIATPPNASPDPRHAPAVADSDPHSRATECTHDTDTFQAFDYSTGAVTRATNSHTRISDPVNRPRLRRPGGSLTGAWLAATTMLIAFACAGQTTAPSGSPAPHEEARPTLSSSRADACAVKEIRKSEIQGLKVYSADGSRFLIKKEDEKGIGQIYIGTSPGPEHRCLTCTQQPGGPRPERFKMQPRWHPSGRWFSVAAEREEYTTPAILGWSKRYVEGQLQCGLWTNMYLVSVDGKRWHRMTDFASGVKGTPDGFTGPAFTPDGTRAVWSQIVDGNILRYWPFGKWELILADFEVSNGIPRFSNLRDITPEGMHWNEPGNFSPDGVSLLLTGSAEKDAQGMDQYILNIETGELTNLTNSPEVWDEHGYFSPDGEKIIFMSAYPYRANRSSSRVLSIKTEFMLMNKDGSGLTQLTRFREPGSPESSGIAANPAWSHDGRSANLAALFFPDYEYWDVVFEGPCGKNPGAPRTAD